MKKTATKTKTKEQPAKEDSLVSDSLNEFFGELKKEMVNQKLATSEEGAGNWLNKSKMGKAIASAFTNLYE